MVFQLVFVVLVSVASPLLFSVLVSFYRMNSSRFVLHFIINQSFPSADFYPLLEFHPEFIIFFNRCTGNPILMRWKHGSRQMYVRLSCQLERV